jgi:hypothetical protein
MTRASQLGKMGQQQDEKIDLLKKAVGGFR